MVILNGGFSPQLTSDVVADTLAAKANKKVTDAKSGGGGDAKRGGSHTHLIRGRHGKEYISPGLVKVNDTTFLEHLYIMLRKCERLYLPRDLFIVGSDAVRTVMDTWCEENDVGFPLDNVVYNGLTEDTMQEQSDVADLALAIEHFKLAETNCPVLVITADQLFYQDFQFGRVIEHAFVRARDVVATYDLVPGQCEVDPNGTAIIRLIGDQKATMGKVKSIALKQMTNEGRAMAPVMVFHRTTIPTVRSHADAGCTNMYQLFKRVFETKTDTECYAIDLTFGRFDCATLEGLRFGEEFNLFYTAQKMVLNRLSRTQDTDSSLDFKTSASGRGDGSKEMNQVLGYGDMLPDMTKAVQAFLKGHFEERTAALSGKMSTIVPENFYVTEYTRNTPVITPRPTPMARTLG